MMIFHTTREISEKLKNGEERKEDLIIEKL